MTDQEQELKVARYIVGAFTALAAWWIWNTVGLSVLVVQSASPNLSATGFSIGVTAMELLGPILIALAFVLHKTGSLVITVVARVLARLGSDPVAVQASNNLEAETKNFVSAEDFKANLKSIEQVLNVCRANDKKLDARLKSAESQIQIWVDEV